MAWAGCNTFHIYRAKEKTMTCPHASSKWVGIVSNNPHPPIDGPHMSQSTCARESCINRAVREVAGYTNQTARLYTYEELRGEVSA